MEGKMDDWARFNVLVEVAEEERTKYEKGKKECSEKERKFRRILSKLLKLANEIEKGNSSGNCSMGQVKKVDLSLYQKGKMLAREKINSEDTMKKLIPQFPNFEGKHQEKDGSVLFSYGDIFKKSSKRLRDMDQEVMPRVNMADLERQILPLPEAFKSKIQSLGGSESQITFVFQKAFKSKIQSCYYSLLTHWNKVVQKNGLQKGDNLQLWGFRTASELGLALVVV